MKVSEIDHVLMTEIAERSKYLISAINAYRGKHKFTQSMLAKRLSCEQGTISKFLSHKNIYNWDSPYGNLSLKEARRFCAAMDTTLGAVLYEYDQHIAQNSLQYDKKSSEEYLLNVSSDSIPSRCNNIPDNELPIFPSCLFDENDNLTNINTDPMFIPWFGTYHCYFYSTLSTEDVCFHGILNIPQTSSTGCCSVNFEFIYNEETKRQKKYYGQLVLSKKTNGAYCTLINHDDQGEIVYLVMANPAVKNIHVCCVLAFAVSISGGKDTNHPCVERMIISREPLDGRDFEIVKAHLLLNDKYIRITEDSFKALLEVDDLPESFK